MATESVLKDLASGGRVKKRKKRKERENKVVSTNLVMGTPASCSARHPAHTVAMDELPLLSVMVLSRRTVNGKSASDGIIGASARSAKFPCPTSRRFAGPMRPVSPTDEGGKK
jgi:hypothetical protein|tara:strand:- start:328 stop:666 length:339 start_codon:yes stop_codon:yes gene_type:complete